MIMDLAGMAQHYSHSHRAFIEGASDEIVDQWLLGVSG